MKWEVMNKQGNEARMPHVVIDSSWRHQDKLGSTLIYRELHIEQAAATGSHSTAERSYPTSEVGA